MSSTAGSPGGERSLGQLVSDLSEQVARLVRAELDLAKAELVTKVKSLGIGAGLLVGAGVIALYLVNVLIATVVIALSYAVPLWLAALIVLVVMLLVTGVLVLIGLRMLKAGSPPTPTRTVENVQEDVTAVKEAISQ